HEERLAATLRAAAVDTEAGDRLRRGVLTEELSPAGFGFGVGDEGSPLPDFRGENRGEELEKARKEERAAERQRRREQEQEQRAEGLSGGSTLLARYSPPSAGAPSWGAKSTRSIRHMADLASRS